MVAMGGCHGQTTARLRRPATRSSRGSGTACQRACVADIPRTADVWSGSRPQGASSPTRPIRRQLRSTEDQQAWVEYGPDAARIRRSTVNRTRVHRPNSGTVTGRIGTEFGVRAPIRVRQVRRHRIACTGADDFGDRGAQAEAPSCSAAAPSRRYGSSTCLAPGGMPENSALANLKRSDWRSS